MGRDDAEIHRCSTMYDRQKRIKDEEEIEERGVLEYDTLSTRDAVIHTM